MSLSAAAFHGFHDWDPHRRVNTMQDGLPATAYFQIRLASCDIDFSCAMNCPPDPPYIMPGDPSSSLSRYLAPKASSILIQRIYHAAFFPAGADTQNTSRHTPAAWSTTTPIYKLEKYVGFQWCRKLPAQASAASEGFSRLWEGNRAYSPRSYVDSRENLLFTFLICVGTMDADPVVRRFFLGVIIFSVLAGSLGLSLGIYWVVYCTV